MRLKISIQELIGGQYNISVEFLEDDEKF